MKITISLFTIFTVFLSFSQIEMYLDGGTTDVSGSVISLNAVDNSLIYSEIQIVNNTGETKVWVVSRLRINEQANWSDYLCYSHETDLAGGVCYAAFAMDYTFWTVTNPVTTLDGEAVQLLTDITPADIEVPVTVTYRYYIGTQANLYEDSIDIEVSTPLSLDILDLSDKKIVQIYDLNGKETPFKPNTPLIFLYDDGTYKKAVQMKF